MFLNFYVKFDLFARKLDSPDENWYSQAVYGSFQRDLVIDFLLLRVEN